jgi:uncharacterized protein (TIGR02466 family)
MNTPIPGLVHRDLFATPVMEYLLPDADAVCAALRDSVIAKRAQHVGIKRSNIGGWHSSTDMIQWAGEPARQLGMKTLEIALKHTSDSGAQPGQPRYEMSMEMWANVSPPGASNQMHAHPGSFWSAVFFLSDGGKPAQSRLVLQDPRFPTPQMGAPGLIMIDGRNEPMISQVHIEPTPGKIVFFPSWVLHSVEANAGDTDRISIAMNIIPIPSRQALQAR